MSDEKLQDEKVQNENLQYGISIKLFFQEKAFGPGVAVLLRNVEKTGSLLGAAKEMNMAYSKAWKILKNVEKIWGFQLTDKETGGKYGGGSTLTPQGRKLLENYEKFCEEGKKELDRIFEQYFSSDWIEEIKN